MAAESWGCALPLFCNGKHDFAMCMEANIANIWTSCHYLTLPIQCPLSLFLFTSCHYKWLGWPAGISLFLSAFFVFYLLFCNFWNRVGSWCLELPHHFILDEQCEKHPVIKVKTTPIISLFHRSSWRCLEEICCSSGPRGCYGEHQLVITAFFFFFFFLTYVNYWWKIFSHALTRAGSKQRDPFHH